MEVNIVDKKKILFISGFILIFFALPLFAQQEEESKSLTEGELSTITKLVAAGFMALASCFCAYCQARAIESAFEGISRNPASAPSIRGLFIIGIVLIESLALYTMVIIFIKV